MSSFLTLKQAETLLLAAIQSDTPLFLEGDPGVGKTALVLRVAAQLGLPAWILQLGEVQEVDVGGMPVVTVQPDGSRQVDRLPLGPLAHATKRAGILFLDDFRTATPPVQGAALRLLQGKAVGDVILHPGARVIMSANPTEQTPGGSPVAAPVRTRYVCVRMRPAVSEIAPFFEAIGNPQGSALDQTLRDLGVDLAATLDRMPDLLELEPPAAAIEGEATWANPRSWERGLRLCAGLLSAGISDMDPLFFHALSGAIGEHQSAAFLSLRKIRQHLPSAQEIENDPTGSRLPTDPDMYTAILGVLAQVAQRNVASAYVYTQRLASDEIRMVLAQRLLRYGALLTPKLKGFKDGMAARVQLQSFVSKARGAEI